MQENLAKEKKVMERTENCSNTCSYEKPISLLREKKSEFLNTEF
jgi:hypothetical protein